LLRQNVCKFVLVAITGSAGGAGSG
jgi:hypothetical protein